MAVAVDTMHLFPRAQDTETASIHSSAPSYVSETPSYHTIAPHPEAIPPYTPPGTLTTSHSTHTAQPRPSSLLDHNSSNRSASAVPRTTGLPPIPPAGSSVPQLSQFRIPTWSTVHSNPTYQNVARRRARVDATDPVASLRRAIFLERVAEDEDPSYSPASPPSSASSSSSSSPSPAPSSSATAPAPEPAPRRPLEDPHLVGEEAAAQARRTRLARERGNEMLLEEDRQWNWFLSQMGDSEERDRSWTRFRNELESGRRRKLSRRLGSRLF